MLTLSKHYYQVWVHKGFTGILGHHTSCKWPPRQRPNRDWQNQCPLSRPKSITVCRTTIHNGSIYLSNFRYQQRWAYPIFIRFSPWVSKHTHTSIKWVITYPCFIWMAFFHFLTSILVQLNSVGQIYPYYDVAIRMGCWWCEHIVVCLPL